MEKTSIKERGLDILKQTGELGKDIAKKVKGKIDGKVSEVKAEVKSVLECKWEAGQPNEAVIFVTSCGKQYPQKNLGGNNFVFCPSCGKRIV